MLNGKMRRFNPDFEQAPAWDRLTQGKHTETDLLLLKHEYVELTLMKIHGYNYDEIHAKANEKHDWQKSVGDV